MPSHLSIDCGPTISDQFLQLTIESELHRQHTQRQRKERGELPYQRASCISFSKTLEWEDLAWIIVVVLSIVDTEDTRDGPVGEH